MQRSPFAPALTEDEQADQLVRKGRNAGGAWIVASVAAFGLGFAARSVDHLVIGWVIGVALFSVGMVVRVRFWKSARRSVGDATIQRARWRSTAVEADSPSRIVVALAVVFLLLGYELWKK